MQFFRKHLKFFGALLILLCFAYFTARVDHTMLVATIGIRNIYALTFVFAVIGGVSTLSAASFYTALFSFALGGANPFLLAAFSAPGMLLGDSFFWYLGSTAEEIVRPFFRSIIEKSAAWLNKKPSWVMPIAVYVYTGFTPLPGDFLMVALAVLGYRFRQIMLPTLLGNYTLTLIISLSAVYELSFVNAIR